MEKDIATRVFRVARDKMRTASLSIDIRAFSSDILGLIEDYFGKDNSHYTNVSKASTYSLEIGKGVILVELDSIISELEAKPSQNQVEKQIKSQKRNAVPLDAYMNRPQERQSLDTQKEESIKRVFIVHGHDGEMKHEVANVLFKLKLEPVILHEEPDEGKTVIEKFEKHSDVDFAVILLSPDDIGYSKDASPSSGRYRARQNVIMELGYFIGKLGRKRVVTLYKQIDNNNNFEVPSDYLGVLYKPYIGDWRYQLADEMRVIDPTIDKNLLK